MDNNYGQNTGNAGEQMNSGYNGGQYYNSDSNYNGGQNYYNGSYNQPYNYNNPQEPYKEEPMTMGQWMITFLVMMIPCVNIIMAFVWAFGAGNVSRKNYFKAYLIFMAIVYAIVFVLAIAFSIGIASSGALYY